MIKKFTKLEYYVVCKKSIQSKVKCFTQTIFEGTFFESGRVNYMALIKNIIIGITLLSFRDILLSIIFSQKLLQKCDSHLKSRIINNQ